MTRHDIYEELAAGFALDALDAEDEALFIAHLAGCARCAADLVRHRTVAADLAFAVDGIDPMPFPFDLGSVPQEAMAPVVSLAAVRSRRTRWLAAAAAVVMLAGVGIGGFAAGHHSKGTPALAQPGVIAQPLLDRTGAPLGELVVKDGQATLTATLPKVKAQGRWYVVWDVRGASTTAVRGFTGTGSKLTVPLGAWQPGDAAAVSLEADGVIPAHGTTMVLTPSVVSSS